jgi:sterol desaturase/sphingolipid hydroxylase (fatty acid hydroxylase superfamily)
MPDLADPIQFAIPAFVALLVAEILFVRATGRGAYCPRDTLASLGLGLGNTLAGLLTGGLLFGVALLLWRHRLFDIGWTWWAWVACFVLDDLAYYASHRFMHRVRWGWASHVIHHSSQHYNLSTALRQTWTGFVSLTWVFRLPLFLAGFPPAMVVFCGGLNLIYQFWIHTEAVGRMPRWFEAVMNTPSHHRVHHAVNPRYLDRNYAGVFIVWDKLFGSFEPERDDEPCRYGIVRNLGSFNILWAAFHEWVGIARDVGRARRWRDRMGYMVGPPGWSPDGVRDTADAIRARWQAEQPEPVAGRDSVQTTALRPQSRARTHRTAG